MPTDNPYALPAAGPRVSADPLAPPAPHWSDPLPPQWPGHKPRELWEWMVTAHVPGDQPHVRHALPGQTLASEQAVELFVRSNLVQYDWIQLYHFRSTTVLTFRRERDGTIATHRTQHQAEGSRT